jgi:hypothetical protein
VISSGEYQALVDEPITGTALVAYAENTATIGTDPESPQATIAFVSDRYFNVLAATGHACPRRAVAPRSIAFEAACRL